MSRKPGRLSNWLYQNQYPLAAVTAFGISLAIAWAVIEYWI